eukprot:GHVT01087803.1.p1 GENE.GHVT01087803.1~~GHVT01087803.1.p1  ORF type:complete len:518 (+),score=40.98 GHVT01087803.1:2737-4290(+)
MTLSTAVLADNLSAAPDPIHDWRYQARFIPFGIVDRVYAPLVVTMMSLPLCENFEGADPKNKETAHLFPSGTLASFQLRREFFPKKPAARQLDASVLQALQAQIPGGSVKQPCTSSARCVVVEEVKSQRDARDWNQVQKLPSTASNLCELEAQEMADARSSMSTDASDIKSFEPATLDNGKNSNPGIPLYSFLQLQCAVRRDAAIVIQAPQPARRREALARLTAIVDSHVNDDASTDVLDMILHELLPPMLAAMADSRSQRNRELAVGMLCRMARYCMAMWDNLDDILPVLSRRMGHLGHDGFVHLPEVRAADHSQQPKGFNAVETSEEVRFLLTEFVELIMESLPDELVGPSLNTITGLLRACAMDSAPEVKRRACGAIASLCRNHSHLLLNFAETIVRSLYGCLTHSHSAIRVAGLRALVGALHCGLYKYNAQIIQDLIAWQEPNLVPIDAFYGGHVAVNYLAKLSSDRSTSVRRYFLKCLAYVVINLPDKMDYEGWLVPYLVTGLTDEDLGVQV